MRMTNFSTQEAPEAPESDSETDRDYYDECTHNGACAGLYERLVDGQEYFGHEDVMVERLGCATCTQWEGWKE